MKVNKRTSISLSSLIGIGLFIDTTMMLMLRNGKGMIPTPQVSAVGMKSKLRITLTDQRKCLEKFHHPYLKRISGMN